VYQLRHSAGDEGSNGWMISDRASLPQPDLRVPAVAGQSFRQNDIAIVSAAGEERHHRDFVGIDLIQYAVEAGLTLMKGNGDLVKETPAS
jgi:hypothetical protein